MTTRFALAVGLALVACGGVTAQPTVAPPPRPSLNEVVKEYRRLGLPLPPPDAPLVRVGIWHQPELFMADERKHPFRPDVIWKYHLGFQLSPPWPEADPRYWFGWAWEFDEWRVRDWYDPRQVEPVEPTPDALWKTVIEPEQAVWMAVACRLRGWDELAERLYARARELYERDGYSKDVISELQGSAYWRLETKLTQLGTDRAEVVRRLKALADRNTNLGHPAKLQDLEELAAGLKTRLSPPGTMESLIDGLIDYKNWNFDTDPAVGEAPYWALADKGFDAVSALIDHLGDERLTRGYSHSIGKGFPGRILTVGHVCSYLLNDLSGQTLGGPYWSERSDPLKPDEVRKWFAAAKKVGEERWLLDLANSADPSYATYRHTLRVLGAKYPARLSAVYRAGLRQHPHMADVLTQAVPVSRLTREERLTLLEEGADRDEFDHRAAALRGLETCDPPRLRHHSRRTLVWLRDRVRLCGMDVPEPDELVPLVERAGDSACWELLAEVAREAQYDDRMSLIESVGDVWPPDKPDPARRDRLRFLRSLLDDPTAEPTTRREKHGEDVAWWSGVEVRHHAAMRLADLLRAPVSREQAPALEISRQAGPLFRFVFREAVRGAVNRELAAGQ